MIQAAIHPVKGCPTTEFPLVKSRPPPRLSFRTPRNVIPSRARNLPSTVGALHFVTNRRVSNTLHSSSCTPHNDSEEALLRMTVRGALLRITARGRHSDPHAVIPSPPNVIPNAPYCVSERSDESKISL